MITAVEQITRCQNVLPAHRPHQQLVSLKAFVNRGASQRASTAPTNLGNTRQLAITHAKRRNNEEDYVVFDDEEDWDTEETMISPSTGAFIQQGLRAVGIIADKITTIAYQFAPEGTSVSVVRTSVNAGLILLALSFVKGILSFILLIGTVVFGAYISVRVFGLDVNVPSSGRQQGGGKKSVSGGQPRRSLNPPNTSRDFSGLLGGAESDADDGLLDVWYDKTGQKPSRDRSRRNK